MQEKGGGSVKKRRCFCAAPRRGGPRLSSDGFCSAEVFQQIEGIRAETRIPSGTSGPVSRVLSFKTAIYLDAPLPTRSSRLPGTVGPTYCPSTALLRIEFTAMDCSQPSGELLPRLSTLTGGKPPAVYLCCTFPRVAPGGCYPLSLPCGARTFLTDGPFAPPARLSSLLAKL